MGLFEFWREQHTDLFIGQTPRHREAGLILEVGNRGPRATSQNTIGTAGIIAKIVETGLDVDVIAGLFRRLVIARRRRRAADRMGMGGSPSKHQAQGSPDNGTGNSVSPASHGWGCNTHI